MKQRGFSVINLLVATGAVTALVVIGVPQYDARLARTRTAEALDLADAASSRLSAFYADTRRMPTDSEAAAVLAGALPQPEFVRELRINPDSEEGAIAIEVYFKDGALTSASREDGYLFMAADSASPGGSPVQWRCGGSGIDPGFLPDLCLH